MLAVGNLLCFVLDDLRRGSQVWRSDGTPEGTFPLATQSDGAPQQLANVGGRVYFVSASEGQRDAELWSSDGTVVGTRGILDSVGDDLYAQLLGSAGGATLFVSERPDEGARLWRLTANGEPQLLVDFGPGTTASSTSFFAQSSSGGFLGLGGGKLLFSIAREDGDAHPDSRRDILYATDGTAKGTKPIADLFGGTLSSNPGGLSVSGAKAFLVSSYPNIPTHSLCVIYCPPDPARGRLWVLDSPDAKPRLLADVPRAINEVHPLGDPESGGNGSVLFSTDRQLWASDGTRAPLRRK